jgi:hypothetical protein
MSEKAVVVSVVLQIQGLSNADSISTEMMALIQQVQKQFKNGVLKFGIDQTTIKDLQLVLTNANNAMIATLAEYVKAFKSLETTLGTSMKIEVEDGDVQKLKTAIEDVFNEVLSKIRTEISALKSVFANVGQATQTVTKKSTGKTVKNTSTAGSKGSAANPTIQSLTAQNLATGTVSAINAMQKERSTQNKLLLARIREGEAASRAQIITALQSPIAFARNSFVENVAKSELLEIGRLTNTLADGYRLTLVELQQASAKLIIAKQDNSQASQDEAADLSITTARLKTQAQEYEEIINEMTKRNLLMAQQVKLSQKSVIYDEKHNKVISDAAHLQARYNNEFQQGMADGNLGVLRSITTQYEKMGLRITSLLKMGDEVKDRLTDRFQQVGQSIVETTNDINNLQNQLQAAAGDTGKEKNLKIEIEQKKDLREAFLAEQASLEQSIILQEKNNQQIRTTSINSQELLGTVRSSTRVMEEQAVQVENTLRLQERLRGATQQVTLAFQQFSKISKVDTGGFQLEGILNPAVLVSATNAVTTYRAAERALEQQTYALITAKQQEINTLNDSAAAKRGQFANETDSDALAILVKETALIDDKYRDREDDLKKHKAELAKLNKAGGEVDTARGVIEGANSFDKMKEAIVKTIRAADNLEQRVRGISKVDISDPNVDLKSLGQIAKATDTELDKLIRDSERLKTELQLLDGGKGLKEFKQAIIDITLETTRLKELKAQVQGSGGFANIGLLQSQVKLEKDRNNVLLEASLLQERFNNTFSQAVAGGDLQSLNSLNSEYSQMSTQLKALLTTGSKVKTQLTSEFDTVTVAIQKSKNVVTEWNRLLNDRSLTKSDRTEIKTEIENEKARVKALEEYQLQLQVNIQTEDASVKSVRDTSLAYAEMQEQIRKSASLIEAEGAIIDKTMNKQVQLKTQVNLLAAAFQQFAYMPKPSAGQYNVQGIVDPSKVVAATAAIKGLENASRDLEMQERALVEVDRLKKEGLKQRYDSGTGEFDNLKGTKEGFEKFKALSKAQETQYNENVQTLRQYFAIVKSLQSSDGYAAAQNVEETAAAYGKLNTSVNNTARSVSNLEQRARSLAELDVSKPETDFKNLAKVAKNVDTEIFKLTQKSEELKIELDLLGGGRGFEMIEEDLKAVIAQILKLQNLKNEIKGRGAFSDDIGIRADLLEKGAKAAEDYSKRLRLAFKQRDEASKSLDSGNTEQQLSGVQDLIRLTSESKKASVEIRRLINDYEQLESAGKSLSDEEKRHLQSLRQSEAGFTNISQELSQYSTQLGYAQKNLSRLRNAFAIYNQEVAQQVTSNFRLINALTIISSVIFGLRAAFHAIIEESKIFARTLTVMQSTGQSLADTYKEVRTVVKQAAIDFGTSVQDAAEIVKQFGSAGFSAEEAMAALVPTLKLVIATQANAELAAKTLAGLYRVFGNELKKTGDQTAAFTRLNDVLISVYRNHQVELDELVQGFKFAAGAAKLSGFSFEETAGLLAVLNDNMIKSGTAGRGLQVVLSQVAKRSDKISEAFGFDLDATKPISDQLIPLLRHVNEQLATGEKSMKDVNDLFSQFGLRGARSFAVLVDQVDALESTFDELKNKSQGISDSLAEIVKGELANQLESAKQALIDMAREGLAPLQQMIVDFVSLIKSVRDLSKSFGSLGPILSSVLGYGALGGAGLSTLLAVSRIFATMAGTVLNTSGALKLFSTSAGRATINANALALSQARVAVAAGQATVSQAALAASVSKVSGASGAGTIGLAITGLLVFIGVIAAMKTSVNDLKNELGQLSAKGFESGQTVQRADAFIKKLDEIEKLSENGGKTMRTMGSIIKNTINEAGAQIVSQAGVANRSLEQIGQKSKDILADARQSAQFARKVAEREKIESDKKELENIKRQIRETQNTFLSIETKASSKKGLKEALNATSLYSAIPILGKTVYDGLSSGDGLVDNTGRVFAKQYQDSLQSTFDAYNAAKTAQKDVDKEATQAEKDQLAIRVKNTEIAYTKQTNIFEAQIVQIDQKYGDLNKSLQAGLFELGPNASLELINDVSEKVTSALESATLRNKLAAAELLDTMEPTTKMFDSFLKDLKAPLGDNVFIKARTDLLRFRNEADTAQKELTTEGFKQGLSDSTKNALNNDVVRGVLTENLSSFEGTSRKENLRAMAKGLIEDFDKAFEEKGESRVLEEIVDRLFNGTYSQLDAGKLSDLITRSANAADAAGISFAKAGNELRTAFANAATNNILKQTSETFSDIVDNMQSAVNALNSFNPNVAAAAKIAQIDQVQAIEDDNGAGIEATKKKLKELQKISVQNRINDKELQNFSSIDGEEPAPSEERVKEGEELVDIQKLLAGLVGIESTRIQMVKQLLFAYKQQGNAIIKNAFYLKDNLRGYKGAFVESQRTTREFDLQAKLLKDEIRILGLISGGLKSNRYATEKVTAILSEYHNMVEQINESTTEQVKLRFQILEKAEQILQPANEYAGIQFAVRGALTDINNLNRQILNVDGKSLNANATKVELYDKILNAVGPLFEIEQKLLKIAQDQNDVLDRRAELYKKLRDVNKAQADSPDAEVKKSIEKQLSSSGDPVSDLIKLSSATGYTIAEIVADQGGAIELYISNVKRGIASASLFGSAVKDLLDQSRSYSEESEGFNEKYKEILKLQQKTSLENFNASINQDGSIKSIEQARAALDAFGKAADALGADPLRQGEYIDTLKQQLELEDRFAKGLGKTENQLLIKLDVKSRDEFLNMMDILRGYVKNISDDVQAMMGSINLADLEKIAAGGVVEGLGLNTSELATNNKNMKSLEKTMIELTNEFKGSKLEDTVKNALIPIQEPVHKRHGGPIPGYGGGDTVPALLERGEFVLPKEAVSKYGLNLLEDMRKGHAPTFASGGEVEGFGTGTSPVEIAMKLGSVAHNRSDDTQKLDIKIKLQRDANEAKAIEDNTKALKVLTDIQNGSGQPKAEELSKKIKKAEEENRDKSPRDDIFKAVVKTVKNYLGEFKTYMLETLVSGFIEFGKSFTETVINLTTKVLVPEFALANGEVLKQFQETSKEIQKTFDDTSDGLIQSLQRNESSYYAYLNGIVDAEKARADARIAAEKAYRESLVETSDVFKNQLASVSDQIGTLGLDFGDIGASIGGALSGIDPQASSSDKLLGAIANINVSSEQIYAKGQLDVLDQSAKAFKESAGGLSDKMAAAKSAFDTGQENAPSFADSNSEASAANAQGWKIAGDLLINAAGTMVGIIVSGLTTFVSSILSFADNDVFDKAFSFIDKFAKELPEAAPKFVDNLLKNTDKIVKKIAEVAPLIIQTIVDQLPKLITGLVDILKESLPGIIAAIAKGLPDIILAIANGIFETLPLIIEQIPVILQSMVAGFLLAVSSLIANLPEIIGSLVTAIIAAIPAIISGVIEALPTLLVAIGSMLIKLGPMLVVAIIKGVVQSVKLFAELVGDAIERGLRAIADFFTGPFDAVGNFFSDTFGGIFHQGGVVGKEVTDTLGQKRKADEYLILAQRGEGVLTSQGLAALGGSRVLESLNDGKNPYVDVMNDRKFHSGGAIGNAGRFVTASSSSNSSSSYNASVNIGTVVVPMNGNESRQQVEDRATVFAKSVDRELARLHRDRKSEFGKSI